LLHFANIYIDAEPSNGEVIAPRSRRLLNKNVSNLSFLTERHEWGDRLYRGRQANLLLSVERLTDSIENHPHEYFA
jgi:hypothetical protein